MMINETVIGMTKRVYKDLLLWVFLEEPHFRRDYESKDARKVRHKGPRRRAILQPLGERLYLCDSGLTSACSHTKGRSGPRN